MSVAPRTQDLLATATRYASLGWCVFPLHSMTPQGRCSCGADVCAYAKHPRTRDGFKSATASQEAIAAWWRTWPASNIGIATGRASGVWVLDVDPDKGGETSLAALTAAHGDLPATIEALTGSGGRHLVFRYTGHIPNSTSRLGPGLDVRGDGGYIVAAPSNHRSGGHYEWQPGAAPWEREPAEAPAWLLELLKPAPRPQAPLQAPLSDNAYRRAQAYLACIPGAVSGSGGHDQTWKAALAVVRGFRLSEGEAVALILSDYNPRCDPPWSEREVLHKVRDAAQSGSLPWGYLLEAKQPPAPRPAPERPMQSRVPGEDDGDEVAVATEEPKPLLDLRLLPELLAEQIPPVEYLIAPWLLRGSFALLVAPPNAGKTLLAFDYALQAATAGSNVVILEEEGGKAGLQSRLRRSLEAAGGRPDAAARVRWAWNTGLSLTEPRHVAALTDACRGADLVVLDSLAALTAGIDENDSQEMSYVAEVLHRLKSETRAAILVLHHMTKEAWKPGQKPSLASLRGHGALAARADTALALVPLEEAAGVVRFELHTVKQREAEKAVPRTIEVTMTGNAATVVVQDVLTPATSAKRSAVDSDVFAKIPSAPEMVSKKFLENVVRGHRAQDIRRAVDRLVDSGRVIYTASGRYTRSPDAVLDPPSEGRPDDPGRPRTTPPRPGRPHPEGVGRRSGTRPESGTRWGESDSDQDDD